MLRAFLCAICALGAGAALAQDETDPRVAYNTHCRQCHSTDEGDNRLGPNLHEVVGRKAGSLEDYAYSDALASADFAWDEERLDEFIADPGQVVSGHTMKPYPGVGDAKIRAAIVAHLSGG